MFFSEISEGQKTFIELFRAPDLNMMSAVQESRDMSVQRTAAASAGEVVPHGDSER